nr:MAG TPA: hypothetical protein [Crassvirales sp.]
MLLFHNNSINKTVLTTKTVLIRQINFNETYIDSILYLF